MLNRSSIRRRPAAPCSGPSRRLRNVRAEGRGKRRWIRGRHRRSGNPVDNEFGIPADARRNDRQRRGHRFQDGVRNTFGQRRQDEQVEALHQLSHIVSPAGEPCDSLQSFRANRFLQLSADMDLRQR